MPNDEIIIRFSVKDDGSPVIERVNKKLGETKKQSEALAPGVEKARAALTNFASTNAGLIAILTATAVALKKFYDVAREGAMLELTAMKFDRLSESIGTTADALLGDLQTATRGMYSDMDLMASATDMVGLGLAKTHDEAVRLSAVSAGLNMDMNQLVLTLTNMTTMRFDALGVSVDGFKEKVAALEAQGYSTNAAFKEAFLQQAEEQLNKVGSAADSAAGAFLRFEAGNKNAMDEFKSGMGQVLLPIIEFINTQREMASEAEKGLTAFEEYARALGMTGPELEKIRWNMSDSTSQFELFNDEQKRVEQYAKAWEKALADGNVVLQETNTNYKDLISNIFDMQDEMDRYNSKQMELTEGKRDLQVKIASLTEQYGAESKQVVDAKNQLSDLNEQLLENGAAHELWAKKTIFAFAQARAAADGNITEGEGQVLIAIGEQLGLFDEKTATTMQNINNAFSSLDSSNAQDVIKAIEDSLKELTGQTYYIDIQTRTTGSVPSSPVVAPAPPSSSGYATGGSFVVGGSGGVDSTPVSFMATPGEVVNISTPEQMKARTGAGGNGVSFQNYGNVNVYANNPAEFGNALQEAFG